MGDVHFSYQCNVFPFLTMRFVGDFLKKTSTSMFLTMFEKTGTSCSRCISEMFFKRLKSSGIFYTHFSNVKQRVNFQNSNSVFEKCRSYSGLHFLLNNQAFVFVLNKVPKTKNIIKNIVLFP